MLCYVCVAVAWRVNYCNTVLAYALKVTTSLCTVLARRRLLPASLRCLATASSPVDWSVTAECAASEEELSGRSRGGGLLSSDEPPPTPCACHHCVEQSANYDAKLTNTVLLSSTLHHCSMICRISPASGGLIPADLLPGLCPWTQWGLLFLLV